MMILYVCIISFYGIRRMCIELQNGEWRVKKETVFLEIVEMRMVATLMMMMMMMMMNEPTHGDMLIRAFVDSYVKNHEDETPRDFAKGIASAFFTLSSTPTLLTDANEHQFIRTRLRVRDPDDGSGGDEYPGTEFYDPETGKMGATEKCDDNNVDVFEECVYKPPKPDTSANQQTSS